MTEMCNTGFSYLQQSSPDYLNHKPELQKALVLQEAAVRSNSTEWSLRNLHVL
ncbi:UNVERIFIED_CONTAM: hypothetical protein FKN15_057664 [Acipenser sinensis]